MCHLQYGRAFRARIDAHKSLTFYYFLASYSGNVVCISGVLGVESECVPILLLLRTNFRAIIERLLIILGKSNHL